MLSFRLVLSHQLELGLQYKHCAHLFGIYTKLTAPGQNSRESVPRKELHARCQISKGVWEKTPMSLTIQNFLGPQLSVDLPIYSSWATAWSPLPEQKVSLNTGLLNRNIVYWPSPLSAWEYRCKENNFLVKALVVIPLVLHS